MGRPTLRLTIELIPETSWGKSLYRVLRSSQWKRLREEAVTKAGNACSICGASGVRLFCHETWSYYPDSRVQRVTGIEVICGLCNGVKHIGRTGILALEGTVEFADVVDHFMAVNRCDLATFKAHVDEAYAKWRESSTIAWTIDWGDYTQLVQAAEEWRHRKS